MAKTCRACNKSKPTTEFYLRRKSEGELYSYCKDCTNRKNREAYHRMTPARRRRWYTKNVEWRRKNRKRFRIATTKYRHKIKSIVIEKYGGKCACCGESTIGFLTIDHVRNDGARHRKAFGPAANSGDWIYRMLVKKTRLSNRFRVLCANCNLGRQWNRGICPHKEKA